MMIAVQLHEKFVPVVVVIVHTVKPSTVDVGEKPYVFADSKIWILHCMHNKQKRYLLFNLQSRVCRISSISSVPHLDLCLSVHNHPLAN